MPDIIGRIRFSLVDSGLGTGFAIKGLHVPVILVKGGSDFWLHLFLHSSVHDDFVADQNYNNNDHDDSQDEENLTFV